MNNKNEQNPSYIENFRRWLSKICNGMANFIDPTDGEFVWQANNQNTAIFPQDNESYINHQDIIDTLDHNTIDSERPTEKKEETANKNNANLHIYKEMADMVKNYDKLAFDADNDTSRDIYYDVINQLIENMVTNGCTAINPTEGSPFNQSLHRTQPISFPTDAIIQLTVRMGVSFNDITLIKAIVKLK